MSKIGFKVTGRLTAFHASEAGGLVICIAAEALGSLKLDELQAIPIGAEATVSVDVEIPEDDES